MFTTRKWWLLLVAALLPLSANADGLLQNRFLAAGAGTPINNIGTAIGFHKITWNVSGTASVCTVALDTSADGITWSAGGAIAGQTCTSNGTSTVATVVANYVRMNMTALTVTAGSSVSVTWTGYVNSPGGGGGSVTSVSATSPIVVTPSPITGVGTVSCATCATGGSITLAAGQIGFGSGSNSITGVGPSVFGSPALFWDNTNGDLDVVSSAADAIGKAAITGQNLSTPSSNVVEIGILGEEDALLSAATSGNLFGVQGTTDITGGHAVTGVIAGVDGVASESGASQTATELTGFLAEGNTASSSATAVNSYGFHARPQAAGGTLNAAFFADDQGTGANDWAYYSAGGKSQLPILNADCYVGLGTNTLASCLTFTQTSKGRIVIPGGVTASISSTFDIHGLSNVVIVGMSSAPASSNSIILFTGTTGPIINASGCTQCRISGIALEWNNAGFTGDGISFATGGGSAAEIDHVIFTPTGAGPALTNCLNLDNLDSSTIHDDWIRNCAVGILGANTNTDNATAISIYDNVFSGGAGTISTSMIRNMSQGADIHGNTFEMTIGVGSPSVISQTVAIISEGNSFNGNWIGDTPAGYNGSLITFTSGTAEGWSFTGNTLVHNTSGTGSVFNFAIAMLGTSITGNEICGPILMSSAANSTGIFVHGNNFCGSVTTGLNITAGNLNALEWSGNQGTPSTYISGTPISGYIANGSNVFTYYGASYGVAAASPFATGSSTGNVFTAPRGYFICTSTCTVTPPVPAAGYEFCVMNDDNVATVITLGAIGTSARYENTARTAYGTAGTGTFISGGAVGDKVCLVGRDSTHYLTSSFTGTWTAN